MKTNVLVNKVWHPRNAHKMAKNACFRSRCSLVTLVHVSWATSVQCMSGLNMCSSSCFLAFLYLFWGLSCMSQCLAGDILIKNGWKKMGIRRQKSKQSLLFCLQEKHRLKTLNSNIFLCLVNSYWKKYTNPILVNTLECSQLD